MEVVTQTELELGHRERHRKGPIFLPRGLPAHPTGSKMEGLGLQMVMHRPMGTEMGIYLPRFLRRHTDLDRSSYFYIRPTDILSHPYLRFVCLWQPND